MGHWGFVGDSRYVVQQSRTDELIHTFGWRDTGETSALHLFARVNHSGFHWNGMTYGGHFHYYPWSWLHLNTLLTQRNWMPDPSSTASLLVSVGLESQLPSWLKGYFDLGHYIRLHHPRANHLLPPIAGGFIQSDWAVRFGLRVIPTDSLSFSISIATFESVDVYNLNNPITEVRANWMGTDYSLGAYLRHQMLLGFGLRDAWVIGATIELPYVRN